MKHVLHLIRFTLGLGLAGDAGDMEDYSSHLTTQEKATVNNDYATTWRPQFSVRAERPEMKLEALH